MAAVAAGIATTSATTTARTTTAAAALPQPLLPDERPAEAAQRLAAARVEHPVALGGNAGGAQTRPGTQQPQRVRALLQRQRIPRAAAAPSRRVRLTARADLDISCHSCPDPVHLLGQVKCRRVWSVQREGR